MAAAAAAAAAATARDSRHPHSPWACRSPPSPIHRKRFYIRCQSDGSGGGDAGRSKFRGLVSLSTFREEPYIEGGGGVGGGGENGRHGGRGGGGGGGRGDGGGAGRGGKFSLFLRGWDERVRTDPEFPFKVAMEEIAGVSANVIGDMASRRNFGLNELAIDFVVGSLVNFTLMYLLAPTGATGGAVAALPGIFSSCPTGHMFEPGSYSLAARAGTFVYKGAVFAAVGFAAGLVETALLAARKRMDPGFRAQNAALPALLNAATWAAHTGVSSNLRYQAVNGLEFGLAGAVHPAVFKAAVLVTRTVNNLLGGYTFVALARMTGSQKAAAAAGGGDRVACNEVAAAVDHVARRDLRIIVGSRRRRVDLLGTGTGFRFRFDEECSFQRN